MATTESGRFRVLDDPDADGWLFLDREGYEPVAVPREGHGELTDAVAGLAPGTLVEATLDWGAADPRVRTLSVVRETEYVFADEITGLFEAARETWAEAERAGEGMGSRVTRNTDGEANGVCYVFADGPGSPDLFAEFRDGRRPIEPLVDRVNAEEPAPRTVFVLRPADEPFVVVYIVLDPGGLLDQTVRDTYGL